MNTNSFPVAVVVSTFLLLNVANADGQNTTHTDVAEQRFTDFLGELSEPTKKECLLIQSEHTLATDKDISARTVIERTYIRVSDPVGKKERLILGVRTVVDDEGVKYERWKQQLRVGGKVYQILFAGPSNQRTLTSDDLKKSGTQRLPEIDSLAMCVIPSQLLFHKKRTVGYAHQMLSGGDLLTASATKDQTIGTWVLGISRKGCVKMTFDPEFGYSPAVVRFIKLGADRSGELESDFDNVTSDARIKWKTIHGKWRPSAAQFSQFQPAKLTKDVEYSSAHFEYLFDESVIDELLDLDDSEQLSDPVKVAKDLIWLTGDKSSQ